MLDTPAELTAIRPTIIRRDLCWLTDPAPPKLIERNADGMHLRWPKVRFCGVTPPHSTDTVLYSIEISEGVEWKDTKMANYINDITATDYKTVCTRANLYSVKIADLKPATWYHIRLVISYNELKVVSESLSTHTERSVPSIPGLPRIHVLPIPNPFDLSENAVIRNKLQITWPTSLPNGSPLVRYQVQLKRIDANRRVIPVESKECHSLRNNEINELLGTTANRESNQWVRSPGKSLDQIRNSIVSRQSLTRQSKADSRHRQPHTNNTSYNDNFGAKLFFTSDSFVDVADDLGFMPFGDDANEQQRALLHSASTREWAVVHSNLNRSLTMHCPDRSQETEWKLRVRALNGIGWSDCSKVLTVNSFTHPSIFAPEQRNYDEIDRQQLLEHEEQELMRVNEQARRQQREADLARLQAQAHSDGRTHTRAATAPGRSKNKFMQQQAHKANHSDLPSMHSTQQHKSGQNLQLHTKSVGAHPSMHRERHVHLLSPHAQHNKISSRGTSTAAAAPTATATNFTNTNTATTGAAGSIKTLSAASNSASNSSNSISKRGMIATSTSAKDMPIQRVYSQHFHRQVFELANNIEKNQIGLTESEDARYIYDAMDFKQPTYDENDVSPFNHHDKHVAMLRQQAIKHKLQVQSANGNSNATAEAAASGRKHPNNNKNKSDNNHATTATAATVFPNASSVGNPGSIASLESSLVDASSMASTLDSAGMVLRANERRHILPPLKT